MGAANLLAEAQGEPHDAAAGELGKGDLRPPEITEEALVGEIGVDEAVHDDAGTSKEGFRVDHFHPHRLRSEGPRIEWDGAVGEGGIEARWRGEAGGSGGGAALGGESLWSGGGAVHGGDVM